MDDSTSTRSEADQAPPLHPAATPPDDSFVTIPPTQIPPPNGQKDTRRYEFQAMLGRGGMGNVYRVLDRSLGRVVALKVIRSDEMSPALRARFADEARAVAGLSHPHIVQVFDVGETVPPGEVAPVPFLTLEYVERGSLAASLLPGQPLAPELAAQVSARIAGGMQHAHDRGIVHRDLKPENVLLAAPNDVAALNTPLGCPKVTDFGLARLVQADRRLTHPGAVMGTPAYMAPEQAEGLPDVGRPADVHALGVILYRLLTGRVPFESDSLTQLLYRIRHESPVPPRRVRPELPEELERICLRCLEKDPRDRPTMGEIASGLERWLQSLVRPDSLTPHDLFSLGLAHGKRLGAEESLVVEGQNSAPASVRPKVDLKWRLGGCSGAVTVAMGFLILLLVVGTAAAFLPLRSWLASLGLGQAGQNKSAPDAGPVTDRLKVEPIRVMHYATVGKEEEPRGRIGDRSTAAQVGDGVTLTVELSEPGYFYVIAFDPQGKEELVWPGDEKGATPSAKPPLSARLLYPSGNNRLDLGDDDKGGLQVYAVVASREPLPPYAEWRAGKSGIRWKAWPAGKGAWEADAKGVYALAGGLTERGGVRKALGTPPLDELCRALGGEGLAVEAIAFGVLPREGK